MTTRAPFHVSTLRPASSAGPLRNPKVGRRSVISVMVFQFRFSYSCDLSVTVSVTVTVIVFQFLFLFQLVILHKICQRLSA